MAIQPMQQPKGNSRLVKTVGAGAAATLLLFVSAWEGKSNDPYKDIVGVWTVCYGETRVQMRRYSDAECRDMLANGLADFAEPVLKRNPELRGHPYQLSAMVSFAYNAGGANYNRSSMSRLFSQGRWVSACNALSKWTFAGGRRVRGLVNRREAERKMCLTGIPQQFAR